MPSTHTRSRVSIIAMTLTACVAAHAADVAVQPAAGSGFVVKDAAGANERLRVQESGAVTLPGVLGSPTQSTGLCMNATTGLLGLCSGGSGSGPAYTAATGLTLTGTTFAVAPSFQLPQSCANNAIAQWNGTLWVCSSATGATLPAGTVNQTLRYDATNAPVANSELQVFADGGVLATDAAVNTALAADSYVPGPGAIPASGPGARMMWYPAKAAFRAGAVLDLRFGPDGTQWNDNKIGLYSIATGLDTQASEFASTAMGDETTASGLASTAMGQATIASGTNSTAMGFGAIASGSYSVAMGFTTYTGPESGVPSNRQVSGGGSGTGDYSTAMGAGTAATGSISTAMGYITTASGEHSMAMGTDASTNEHPGSFIYADYAHYAHGEGTATNDADNQFKVVAAGGIALVGVLDVAPPVQGTVPASDWSYYAYNSTYLVGHWTGGPITNVAINSHGRVVADEFDAVSDARIKDIHDATDSAHDLATLNAIEVTDYTMKDKVQYGNRPFKKVIAQQVEQVYPQIVSKHSEFIPNVYRLASHIDATPDGYTLRFDTPHGIARTAKKLKLMPEGSAAMTQVDILAVPSAREVTVKAAGWNAERVFVYGEEVDDFRSVDYEGLAALNVSATQELSRHIDAQQTQQSQLTAQLADKNAQIDTLRSDLAAQKAHIAAQDARIASLESVDRDFVDIKRQLAALQQATAAPRSVEVALQP